MTLTVETYREFASSSCPLLVIHGWEMSSDIEVDLFESIFSSSTYLNSSFRRIYITLPGHGGSPANGAACLDDMLAQISSYIDTKIPSSSFVLAGSSAGAYFVRALAFKYADRVAGVCLRVPLVEPDNARRDVDPFAPVIANEANLSILTPEEREKMGPLPVQTSLYIEEARRRFHSVVKPALDAADHAVLDPIRGDPQRYRLTAAMHTSTATFAKPSLIVTGRQDTVVGYRDAIGLLGAYPRATFVLLDRADHGLPVDDSESRLFAESVKDWLRRVEEVEDKYRLR